MSRHKRSLLFSGDLTSAKWAVKSENQKQHTQRLGCVTAAAKSQSVKTFLFTKKPQPHEQGIVHQSVPLGCIFLKLKKEIISSKFGPVGLKNVCYLPLDEVNSLTYQPHEAVPP